MKKKINLYLKKKKRANKSQYTGLSSLNIPLRKQEMYQAEKKTYAWRNSWDVCILLAGPQVTESDTFMTMLAPEHDSCSVIQANAPRVHWGLVGVKSKGCQTSSLWLQQHTFRRAEWLTHVLPLS